MPVLSEDSKDLDLVATDLQVLWKVCLTCQLLVKCANLVVEAAPMLTLPACRTFAKAGIAAHASTSPDVPICRAGGTSCTTASGATQAPVAASELALVLVVAGQAEGGYAATFK